MEALRVGIVGPARTRNGLGPYVARFMQRQGFRVRALLSSSLASAKRGAKQLAEQYGMSVRPFSSLDQMVAEEGVRSVAICSPAVTHQQYLSEALDLGLHVFCDKPLIWDEDSLYHPVHVELIEQFESRGLVLHENTQWVYTLADFRRLHGTPDTDRLKTFAMRLSPAAPDASTMLREAASHGNSMVLALGLQGRKMERIRLDRPSPDSIDLRFTTFTPSGRPVCVTYHWVYQKEQPRQAWYAMDGARFERLVDRSDYSMAFTDGRRTIPVQDPLEKSVIDFKYKLRRAYRLPLSGQSKTLLDNLFMLDQLQAQRSLCIT